MKSSKFFLGIGAAALAAVGAIATATAHRITPVFYSTGTACVRVDQNFSCQTAVIRTACTFLVGSTHRQLFATINPLNSKKCAAPLFKTAGL